MSNRHNNVRRRTVGRILIATLLAVFVVGGWYMYQARDVDGVDLPFKTINTTTSGVDQSQGHESRVQGHTITVYGRQDEGSGVVKITRVIETDEYYTVYVTQEVPGSNCIVEGTFAYPQTIIHLPNVITKPVRIRTSQASDSC